MVPANQNEPRRREVALVESDDSPGVWIVEAIDWASDGGVYQAIFAGPQSRERALAYLDWVYGQAIVP